MPTQLVFSHALALDMSGRYGGLCMEDKSKHSLVKERIELATAVIGFLNEFYDFMLIVIDLFNMAFNYSYLLKK